MFHMSTAERGHCAISHGQEHSPLLNSIAAFFIYWWPLCHHFPSLHSLKNYPLEDDGFIQLKVLHPFAKGSTLLPGV